MAILDSVTPTYYKMFTLDMERVDSDVIASYNIAIYNVNGNVMTRINYDSTLTPEEKTTILAILVRDKENFETATGLEPQEE